MKAEVGNLKSLLNSEWWKLLEEELDNKISDLEQEIFSINKEQNEIKYSKRDLDIIMREFLIDFKSKPETLIKVYE